MNASIIFSSFAGNSGFSHMHPFYFANLFRAIFTIACSVSCVAFLSHYALTIPTERNFFKSSKTIPGHLYFDHLNFKPSRSTRCWCTFSANDMNWDPKSGPKLDFNEDFYAVLEVNSTVTAKDLVSIPCNNYSDCPCSSFYRHYFCSLCLEKSILQVSFSISSGQQIRLQH